jgi:hypothetical protein
MTMFAISNLLSKFKRVDRRGSIRVPVDLKAKLLIIDEKREVDCVIINWSFGGAGILCSSAPIQGTKVVLRVSGFGSVQGTTVGTTKDATGIRFDATDSECALIAEQFFRFLEKR